MSNNRLPPTVEPPTWDADALSKYLHNHGIPNEIRTYPVAEEKGHTTGLIEIKEVPGLTVEFGAIGWAGVTRMYQDDGRGESQERFEFFESNFGCMQDVTTAVKRAIRTIKEIKPGQRQFVVFSYDDNTQSTGIHYATAPTGQEAICRTSDRLEDTSTFEVPVLAMTAAELRHLAFRLEQMDLPENPHNNGDYVDEIEKHFL